MISRKATLGFCVSLALVVLLTCGHNSWAQQPAPTSPPVTTSPSEVVAPVTAPTVEQLQQQIKQLEEATDLDEAIRATVRDHYEQAIHLLGEAAASAERAAQLQQLRDTAPQRLAAIEKELAVPVTDPLIKLPADATLADAKQGLQSAKAAAEEAKAALTALDSEAQQRATRRLEVPKELIAATQRLAELKPKTPAVVEGQAPKLAAAALVHHNARRLALTRQIEALTMELSSYEARGPMLTARRDLAARRATQEAKLVEAWEPHVNRLRDMDLARAREEARQAQREAASKHPGLKAIADETTALVDERTGLSNTRKMLQTVEAGLKEQHEVLQQRLTDVESRFKATQRPTETFGLLLRKIRRGLPDIRTLRRNLAERQKEIERVQVRLIDLDADRRELVDVVPIIDRTVKQLDPPVEDPPQVEDIRAALQTLLQNKRDELKALRADYDLYFDELTAADTAERALERLATDVASYIEERVLWVRSAEPVNTQDIKESWQALGWVMAGENWSAARRALSADAARYPTTAFCCALLMAIAIITSLRARWLVKQDLRHSKGEEDTFGTTLKALLATVLLTLPLPLLCWLIGWRLRMADAAESFVPSVAAGFQHAAIPLALLLFLRQVASQHGLGPKHFRWRTENMVPLRRHATWLIFIMPPAIFLITVFDTYDVTVWSSSLGRAAFVVTYVAGGAAIASILRPSTGVLSQILKDNPDGWLNRLRMIWYSAAVVVPLFISVLAIIGYYYSALKLADRLVDTGRLLLIVIVVNALVRRWLYIERRTLALEQRRRRRVEQEAAAAEGDSPSGTATEEEIPIPEVDLYQINVQTRKLLGTFLTVLSLIGIWLIWADVLPALGYLNSVELWAFEGSEKPITVISLAMSVILVVLTLVAARNIPGLLEILMLQRLPLEPAVRFAIATLCRYFVTIAGLVLAFNAIGIGWSKVQWLAAAVTVGLGFGLQEIFANFVSGLIILFEQPIRVGDTVTVNNVTGIVTKIRTRATTITDWDRKDLVVPNKTFITGELINWELSDPLIRSVIPVGVAYGSDTRLAQELLLKVARKHPHVLDDPPPSAVFRSFGDNSLNLELRVFCDDILVRIILVSELHTAIDEEFRKAGIVIAFPQRDVHLDSLSPIKIELVTDEGQAVGPTSAK